MQLGIEISTDGDWNAPQIQISGSQAALLSLGALLNDLTESSEFEFDAVISNAYDWAIPAVALCTTPFVDGLLQVSADEEFLRLLGDTDAFRKLGSSLVTFFSGDVPVGRHFHLDYYPGNQVLRSTTCSLIFLCDQ